jgi:DNA-binding transcriptional LysR family regulator
VAVGDLHPRHLRMLLELERRGSMREVAAASGYSTSAVSAQLAALERDAGVPLLERDGRRVRLTPAGRRLGAHARTILAASEAARADLATDAPVAGRVRVAAYATALAGDCLAVTRALRASHPALEVELQERDPEAALALVEDGSVDIAFVYDYSLAPRGPVPGVDVALVCDTPMLLALPAERADPVAVREPSDLAGLAGDAWIVDSRGPGDEELLSRVAASAGFVPVVRHRVDALDVVFAFVAAGLGVALVPGIVDSVEGVRLLGLGDVGGTRRMAVATRPGHGRWPPVALVAERVGERARRAAARAAPPGEAVRTASAVSSPRRRTLSSRMRYFWTLPVTVIGNASTTIT